MSRLSPAQSAPERRIWQRCFWTGIVMLVLGAVVITLFPASGGPYPAGYGEPVIAFEFAQTPQEVQTVLGFETRADWEAVRKSMRVGTIWDFPFLCVYTFFMLSFFQAAKRQTGHALYKFFAAIAFIAGAADLIENMQALQILSDIALSQGAALMHYFVKAKFMALGLVGLGAGLFLWRQPRPLRKIEGVFAAAGGVITLAALTRPDQFGNALGIGTMVSWLAMLAYAATQSFKSVKA